MNSATSHYLVELTFPVFFVLSSFRDIVMEFRMDFLTAREEIGMVAILHPAQRPTNGFDVLARLPAGAKR